MKGLYACLLGLLLVGSAPAGELALAGEGVVTAKPDVGYIVVGVVTEDEEVAKATELNNRLMTKLMATLGRKGLKGEEMKTADFSIRPRYVSKKDEEPKLTGYTVSNMLHVTVCDLPKMGEILDAVVKDGANRVQSIRFGVKNPGKLLNEARVLACKDVKEKATIYACNLSLKLVKIKSVSESHGGYGMNEGYARMADAAPGRVPVSGGELTFKMHVQVTWEVAEAEQK